MGTDAKRRAAESDAHAGVDDDTGVAARMTFGRLLAANRRFRQKEREAGPVAGAGPPEAGGPPDAAGGYRSPEGRHRHQCPACGTIYEHEDGVFGVRAGHTCPDPACRHCPDGGVWDKYFGPLPPAYHDPGQKSCRRADDGAPLEKQ